MIVDTHVHVTSADRVKYPFDPPDRVVEKLNRILVTAEDLIQYMDEGGVERAVLVQATPTHGHDNSYAVDSAAKYPHRFSSVGALNVARGDAVERLTYWVQERNLGGIRLFNAMDPHDTWLDDPRCLDVIKEARRLDIPVTMVSLRHDLERVRNAITKSVGLPIALEHMGHMPNREDPPFEATEDFLSLAEFPNVSIKFSAVNQWAAAEQGTVPPEEYFKRIIDRFGPRRLMWGTNYPATRFKSYAGLAAMRAAYMSFLNPEELGWILGGNALRLWPAPKG